MDNIFLLYVLSVIPNIKVLLTLSAGSLVITLMFSFIYRAIEGTKLFSSTVQINISLVMAGLALLAALIPATAYLKLLMGYYILSDIDGMKELPADIVETLRSVLDYTKAAVEAAKKE